MFQERQIKRIVPLIVKEDKLLASIGHMFACRHFSKEEVLSSLFPRHLELCYASMLQHDWLVTGIKSIKLSGCGCVADGEYFADSLRGGETWKRDDDAGRKWEHGQLIRFFVEKRADHWEIVGKIVTQEAIAEFDFFGWHVAPVIKVFWSAPNSGNYSLPPTSGWKSVDEIVKELELGIQQIEHLSHKGRIRRKMEDEE